MSMVQDCRAPAVPPATAPVITDPEDGATVDRSGAQTLMSGTAAPGAQVAIMLQGGGQRAAATADANGDWTTSGSPYRAEDEGATVTFVAVADGLTSAPVTVTIV